MILKPGLALVKHAQQVVQCKSIHALLENTPWGKSNHKTIVSSLGSDKKLAVSWFNWNTQLSRAKITVRDIIDSNADCIIFVGNAIEGSQFVNAMASFPKERQIPIVSHWGITGGNFYNQTQSALRQGVTLHFIQSCFSLREYKSSPQATLAVNSAQSLFPDLTKQIEILPRAHRICT